MSRRPYAPWLWLLPAGALLVPFFVLPLGIVVRNSVFRDDPNGFMVADFTVANYVRVLTDSYYLQVFSNTLLVAGIVTVLSLVIAYPFAQLIARAAGRAQTLLLWAVYMPLYVSVIMRAFGWTIILADSGLINKLLLGAGIIRTPIRMLYELEGLTLGMLHRYLPLMIIPLVAALQKVDISLLKASKQSRRLPRPDLVARDGSDVAAGHRRRDAAGVRGRPERLRPAGLAGLHAIPADRARDLLRGGDQHELGARRRHGNAGLGRGGAAAGEHEPDAQALRAVGVYAMTSRDLHDGSGAALRIYGGVVVCFLLLPIAVAAVIAFSGGQRLEFHPRRASACAGFGRCWNRPC